MNKLCFVKKSQFYVFMKPVTLAYLFIRLLCYGVKNDEIQSDHYNSIKTVKNQT